MSRNKDLAKNTLFVIIGSLGGSLVSFLMLPLYTRWLSPADYGVTDIIQTYSNLLMFIVIFSITDAIFVFPVGQTKENITKYFSTGAYFILLCSIVCALVFYIISLFNLQNEFAKNIWLIYGVLISSIILRYTQDFCRGIKKMAIFSYTGIIQSFSIAACSFLFIPKWGVTGYVIASILACMFSAIFSFIYSKSYKYLRFDSFDFSFLKEMLKYSIPLIPTSVMWWLVSSINRPLLEQYVGMAAIGLFAVANKLPSILNMFFGFFQKAWQVTAIEQYNSPDFSDYYNKMFRMIYGTQTLVTLIITLFAKLFINVMTTPEYYDAWVYIPLLCLSVLFSNVSAFCGTIFSANRHTKYTLYSVIAGGVTAVVANFVLIPLWGLAGSCVAICLSHLVSMVSRIIFAQKYVTFKNTLYIIYQIAIVFVLYAIAVYTNPVILTLGFIVTLVMLYFSNKREVSAIVGIIRTSKIGQYLSFKRK